MCATSALTLALHVGLIGTVSTVNQAHAQTVPQAPSSVEAGETLVQDLFLAIENQDLDGVKNAIGKGADVEARDFTGNQPVDLAISRGYFEIAHYLISVRNAKQAALSGTPVQPAPSVEELARTALGKPPAPPAPTSAPVEKVEQQTIVDPFSTKQAAGDLPVLGKIQTPETPTSTPESTETAQAPAETPDDQTAVVEEAPALAESSAPDIEVTPPQTDVALTSPAQDAPEISQPEPEDVDIKLADAQEASPEPEPEESVEITIEPQQDDPVELSVAPEVSSPVAPAQEVVQAGDLAEKPSAMKRFFTTFLDFFSPPNVTGVVHKKREVHDPSALSEEELARELQQLEAERGNQVIKGPAVPISPDELAKVLPPVEGIENLTPEEIAALPRDENGLPKYSVSSPARQGIPADDAFGDLTISDEGEDDNPFATEKTAKAGSPKSDYGVDYAFPPGHEGQRYNPARPFGGGVDPWILDYLGLSLRNAKELTGKEDESDLREMFLVEKPVSFDEAEDAIAGETGGDGDAAPTDDNPFALGEDDKEAEVADLLKDVTNSAPKPEAASPKPEAASPKTSAKKNADNPFDMIEDDGPGKSSTKGEADELAGLLEPTGQGQDGWDVVEVENANIPDKIFVLTDIEPTGEVLDNVDLTLGIDIGIGRELDQHRLKLMEQDTIRRPCLEKGGPNTIFCTDKINWPFELEEVFLVDTIMYQGTRAISRYEAGRATNYHTLFRNNAFEQVVGYYTERYGQPTVKVDRAIAPLAAPRQDNPTFIWKSREAGTDTVVNLEIRKFDDAKDSGFPDTRRGVIMLYRDHAKPIFPLLSQLDLMILKTEGVETASTPMGDPTEGTPDENVDPSSIWN